MTGNRTRRNLVAATAAALMATFVAACSSPAPNADSDTTVVHWLTARNENETVIAAVRQIAEEYSAEHPEFKLEIETQPDRPAFDQKIRLLASSDELPDMFDADPEPFFREIVESGKIADIAALYDELGVTDEFFPISIEYPAWDDGALNLITLNANVEYFWYNTSLFEEAGVEPPTTLDELPQICEKLSASGVVPISVNGKDLWPFYRYLAMPAFRATGNEFLDSLKIGETSMTDEVGLESAQFLESLGGCFQEGFSTTDYTTSVNLFTSGQAAIYYMGTWELPSFLGEDGDLNPEFSYFKMPKLGDDDATHVTDYFANSGIGTAIRADSLTPELKDFLAYFFENYAETAFYDFDFIPSLEPELDDSVPPIYHDILADIAEVQSFAKVWDVQLDPNTNSVLGRESTTLLLGDSTVEQMAEQVDAAIAQYMATRE